MCMCVCAFEESSLQKRGLSRLFCMYSCMTCVVLTSHVGTVQTGTPILVWRALIGPLIVDLHFLIFAMDRVHRKLWDLGWRKPINWLINGLVKGLVCPWLNRINLVSISTLLFPSGEYSVLRADHFERCIRFCTPYVSGSRKLTASCLLIVGLNDDHVSTRCLQLRLLITRHLTLDICRDPNGVLSKVVFSVHHGREEQYVYISSQHTPSNIMWEVYLCSFFGNKIISASHRNGMVILPWDCITLHTCHVLWLNHLGWLLLQLARDVLLDRKGPSRV